MDIALFGVAHNPRTRIALRGLKATGNRIFPMEDNCWSATNCRDHDVIIIDGFKRKSVDILRHYAKRGASILVVDAPMVRIDDQYSVRVVNADHYRTPVFGLPDIDRIDLLGIDMSQPEKRSKSKRVLLCGQIGSDMSHGMGISGIQKWIMDAYEVLSEQFKVLWRPHPEHVWSIPGADESTMQSLAEDLKSCSRMCTHSSTSAITALIAGIPVACNESAFYSDLAVRPDVDKSEWFVPDRESVIDLIGKIASRQFTEDEIVSGHAFNVVLGDLC